MIGFYIPYLFIMKTATNERNVPEHKAVFLLSLIGKFKSFDILIRHVLLSTGFSNTAVRFASGWITKIPFITPLLANNLGLALAGLATLLVPFCSTYTLLVTYAIIWGGAIGKTNFLIDYSYIFILSFMIAFHISLTPVVVCQLVGLEKYSSALGLVFMFRGIASLIAPPVCKTRSRVAIYAIFISSSFFQVMGAVQDYTSSFNVPFVISGISFIGSSALHFILLSFMHPSKTQSSQKKTDGNTAAVNA